MGRRCVDVLMRYPWDVYCCQLADRRRAHLSMSASTRWGFLSLPVVSFLLVNV